MATTWSNRETSSGAEVEVAVLCVVVPADWCDVCLKLLLCLALDGNAWAEADARFAPGGVSLYG